MFSEGACIVLTHDQYETGIDTLYVKKKIISDFWHIFVYATIPSTEEALDRQIIVTSIFH